MIIKDQRTPFAGRIEVDPRTSNRPAHINLPISLLRMPGPSWAEQNKTTWRNVDRARSTTPAEEPQSIKRVIIFNCIECGVEVKHPLVKTSTYRGQRTRKFCSAGHKSRYHARKSYWRKRQQG